MKIALITDTHWGARGDSPAFAEYFNRFYYNQFFPYLEENGIKTIFHLGDICDRRKYINFVTARHLRNFMDTCSANDIDIHVIIGNHDTTYKNTNEVNCMKELYDHTQYSGLKWYESPTTINLDGTDLAILPWVCSGNFDDSMDFLRNTTAQILFGHLEIAGFEMYKGAVNDHGFDSKIFDKFDTVCSGHFHHKSTRGNINYLGAPYEMSWSDYNDPRGFHVFDTETRELEFIRNPLTMFNKVHYHDQDKTLDELMNVDFDYYKGSYVKMIVHTKTNPYWFDMFVDKIEKAGVLDLQVVDDNLNLQLEDDGDIVNEAEDTLTVLSKVVDQVESRVDKKVLYNFLSSLYNEALSVE